MCIPSTYMLTQFNFSFPYLLFVVSMIGIVLKLAHRRFQPRNFLAHTTKAANRCINNTNMENSPKQKRARIGEGEESSSSSTVAVTESSETETTASRSTSVADFKSANVTVASAEELLETKIAHVNSDADSDGGKKNPEWITIDPKTCKGIYGLGISAVGPRPVAVISSKSKNGDLNCAPFSYTGLLSHDPPMVAHGLCLSRSGRKKDTLVNIEETKEWVYNVLSEHWLEQANACAEEVDRNVNELELDSVNLSTIPCDNVDIPRVKEALVSMECELESKKEIINDAGKHTTTVVFGRIVKYHIHHSVLGGTEEKPVIDLEKIRFCGRVGDVTYWPAGSGKALPLKRP